MKPAKPAITLRPGVSSSACHAWFEAMRARPSCLNALTLRDQAEIDAATPKQPNALYRYVWPSDDHPEASDAAKYTLPPLKADGSCQPSQPTNQKIELPLNVSSGIVIVAWDFYYAREWKTAFTPIEGEDWSGYKFKTFQITHPKDKIYFEFRNLWGKARGDHFVSVADIRTYDMSEEFQAAAGVVEPVGYMPSGERAIQENGSDAGNPGGLDIPWGEWLRYYAEVQINVDERALASWNAYRPTAPPQQKASGESVPWPAWSGPVPPGRYNVLSAYIAGESFDPVCVLDRVPAFHKTEGGADCEIGKFYFEMNTSSTNERHGDAIAYARNVVAWRADRPLAEDPSPLERPIA